MPQPSPIIAGLQCRCFSCGEGRVFRGYLTLKPKCETCGQDFRAGETADGPAFFAMFATLILFGPFAFILPLTQWPVWVLILAYIALLTVMMVFVLWLLRPLKAIMLNLQLRHSAQEARFEEQD